MDNFNRDVYGDFVVDINGNFVVDENGNVGGDLLVLVTGFISEALIPRNPLVAGRCRD